jgi:hypothetical protein
MVATIGGTAVIGDLISVFMVVYVMVMDIGDMALEVGVGKVATSNIIQQFGM